MGIEATEEVLLKTPLYNTHVKYRGKIIPFTGYLLPIQYETGVINERMAVCTKCGLFDVSHMGEVICKGPDAPKNLNMLLTNDYTVIAEGQARYSPMCNERGGVVGGLIMYKVRSNCYFIVVNAANKDKDYTWTGDHQSGDVVSENVSSRVAQPTLQGPKAIDVLKKVTKEGDIPKKYYTCLFNRMVGGMKCIISKIGYTGEDGMEICLVPEDTPEMWELLMEAGKDKGLIPCGLGARDTSRLGAGIPLYGHEMDDTISPKEAGSGIFAEMDKDDFIGKQAIQDEGPLTGKHMGLKVTGRGIIREHQRVCIGEQRVGMTTSGIYCPFLGYPAAMAPIDIGFKDSRTVLGVDVRGRRVATGIVKLPFYKRQ